MPPCGAKWVGLHKGSSDCARVCESIEKDPVCALSAAHPSSKYQNNHLSSLLPPPRRISLSLTPISLAFGKLYTPQDRQKTMGYVRPSRQR